MPGTIQNFFASIDPVSPPSEMHQLDASVVEAPGTAPGSTRSPL
jgi:hypothetical protein